MFDPRRWWNSDYRIVQTNLREIDALEDPRDIARATKEFGANVIVSNIGGIVSFYPTALAYHYKNRYLRGDFVGEMIEAAHSEGMAYLGRFDLSKAMKPTFDAHPEWFTVNRDGTPRRDGGTYVACPSGGWAQDYSIEILREALTRYKPEGVFFNAGRFHVTDYAGVDHGSCVCDNCRRAFRAMYNRDLPKVDNSSDPAWRDYQEFQGRVLGALRNKIDAVATPLLGDAPISGRGVFARGEFQRKVKRSAPEWPYQGGEQPRRYMASTPGRPFSATSAAHIDFPWRQVTETAACHELRLAQAMGVGAHLDLYLMGTLASLNDQSWLPPVSRMFKWRAANSAAYEGMDVTARVGVYDSFSTQQFTGAIEHFEYETPYRAYQVGALRGTYTMLVDSRIPFRFANDRQVASGAMKLNDKLDVLLLPNNMVLSTVEASAIDTFVENGGLLIATGMPGSYDTEGKRVAAVPLACLPTMSYGEPMRAEGWTLDPARGALKVTGRVPLDGFYYGGVLRDGVTDLLPFAPDQHYGPPEFSYAAPDATTRDVPGVAVRSFGKGKAVHIPWHIDWQYYRDGLPVHQGIIANLIAKFAPPQKFILAGNGSVELMQLGRASGQSLLHVINYVGQRNGRYETAPKLHGLRLGVHGVARDARALVGGQTLPGKAEGGRTWFDLPPVGVFEALLV